MSPPVSVSPEPAFIAASAASQIITNDHDSHANTWYDEQGMEPSGEAAIISNAALQLVNNFLDQLLFNFLSLSRSTSLAALRPAVTEVLKPKLAKDAINQADEELREYLGGGDDDDMLPAQRTLSQRDWDIELVWKRTRLRCMVYSSLGDMEEEDEDFYMEQGHLDTINEDASDTVSPAVAIFLTSILEFMGEQALVSASQAAYHRMRFIYEKDPKHSVASATPRIADRVSVEEVDMERVAFDRTIGRLWRAWKKRIRSPVTDGGLNTPVPSSRGSGRSSSKTRRLTEDSLHVPAHEEGDSTSGATSESQQNETAEFERGRGNRIGGIDEEWLRTAALIPLPVDERDVADILVPGLARYSDDEEEATKSTKVKGQRPMSLLTPPRTIMNGLPTPTTSEPRTPELPPRKRSNSLPTPTTSPYSSPQLKHTVAADDEIPVVEEGDKILETTQVDAQPVAIMAPPAPSLGKQKLLKLVSPLQTSSIQRTAPVADITVEDEEIEDFTEEPQILITSRVSISGRSNSPTTSDLNRPLSVGPVLPPGSPSLHSPRVIDVTGPRSPIMRTRGCSIDTHELQMHRASNVSRGSSASTLSRSGSSTPSVDGNHKPSDLNMVSRASFINAKVAKTYTGLSISEAEEIAAEAPKEKAKADKARPKTSEDAQPKRPPSKLVTVLPPQLAGYGSPTMSPMHPPPPMMRPGAPTKVTILGSTSSSHFYMEGQSKELPRLPEVEAMPEPVVPERSARRATANSPVSAKPAEVGPAVPPVEHVSSRREVPSASHASAHSSANAGREQILRAEAQARAQAQAEAHAQMQALARSQSQLHALGGAGHSPLAAVQEAEPMEPAPPAAANKMKPVRTSEESTTMRPEDVARNFEELIQSDETIQFTLTPENMRDIDGGRSSNEGSGSILTKGKRSDEIRQISRSRSSSVNTGKHTETKHSPSISRVSTSDARTTDASSVKLNGPVPHLPHGLSASMSTVSFKSRSNGPQARDARIERESLADFAEFIRATGPPEASSRHPRTLRKGRAGSESFSTSSHSPGYPGLVRSGTRTSRTSSSGSHQPQMQMREAMTGHQDGKSDLIDFIRRGPPSASGNPRIPQAVAPFQTAGSDQMTGAMGGQAVDATIHTPRYSAASTSVTESSTGSSAGLIRNKAPPATVASVHENEFDEMDMMPKRKTRRVRDPYAIDLSDEDDEELFLPPGRKAKPAIKEESLMDFLNSVPPPPPEPLPPLEMPHNRQAKKKASASSLMSRFVRGSSSGSRGLFSSSGDTGSVKSGRLDARSLSSRAGSTMSRNHVPLQVHMPPGMDKYGSSPNVNHTNNIHNSHISNNNTGSGRVPMKKFEPREAQHTSTRATQDMADFFRNSGPPQSFRG